MATASKFVTTTLADRWDGRSNSLGLLRLALALCVLLSHSMPLGFGKPNIGLRLSHSQTDVGTAAVYGFFIISGFLVSGSVSRLSTPRYLWHRAVRIYPGLWVALVFTAVVLAPLVTLVEGASLSQTLFGNGGSLDFIASNWTASARQYTIGGLLEGTPYGGVVGGPSAFIGSWWSLRYEVGCYAALAVLSIFGLWRRQRLTACLTLVLGAVCWVVILTHDWNGRPPSLGYTPSVPMIGSLNIFHLLFLTLLFLVGAALRTWRRYIPLGTAPAIVAGLALIGSILVGGFLTFGVLAYAYLIIWLAVSLPNRCQRVGRVRDYSYGVYIYGFGVQQLVALVGGARFGFAVYFALTLVGTLLLSAASWHWVEERALRMKDWTPALLTARPSNFDNRS